MRHAMAAALAAVLLASAAGASEFYVSPKGTPQGPGSRQAPLDLATVLTGKAPVKPGDTVWLLGGVYVIPADPKSKMCMLRSDLKGTAEKPIVVRQAPGERVTLDGALDVYGADTWYWGFEVRGTRGTPREAGNRPMNVLGPRVRMINLVIHRGSMGYGFWSPAVDAEIYGNLVFDFGFMHKTRGGGHACYTQNETGAKRVVDNVMFAGYGWNLHNYTKRGQIIGYHIEGNFFFSAGMAAPPWDAPKDNIIICGKQPGDRYALIDNVAYHPRTGGWRYNVRLSTYMGGDKTNGAAVLKGNYFMGYNGLALIRWLKITATGNEIWAPAGILHTLKGAGAKDADWVINNNVYHALPGQAKFDGKTFAQYRQATGFDKDSRLVATVKGRPTGTRVFVRPNRYEPGRAHIAVFNWGGKDTVSLDLTRAGLKRGQEFQIRNVMDVYGKPVAQGTYDREPVSVPMRKDPIAPDFDAFLVVPEESFGCFAARADEPGPDWSKHDWRQLHWKKAK